MIGSVRFQHLGDPRHRIGDAVALCVFDGAEHVDCFVVDGF
jgi:hypothetical protein